MSAEQPSAPSRQASGDSQGPIRQLSSTPSSAGARSSQEAIPVLLASTPDIPAPESGAHSEPRSRNVSGGAAPSGGDAGPPAARQQPAAAAGDPPPRLGRQSSGIPRTSGGLTRQASGAAAGQSEPAKSAEAKRSSGGNRGAALGRQGSAAVAKPASVATPIVRLPTGMHAGALASQGSLDRPLSSPGKPSSSLASAYASPPKSPPSRLNKHPSPIDPPSPSKSQLARGNSVPKSPTKTRSPFAPGMPKRASALPIYLTGEMVGEGLAKGGLVSPAPVSSAGLHAAPFVPLWESHLSEDPAAAKRAEAAADEAAAMAAALAEVFSTAADLSDILAEDDVPGVPAEPDAHAEPAPSLGVAAAAANAPPIPASAAPAAAAPRGSVGAPGSEPSRGVDAVSKAAAEVAPDDTTSEEAAAEPPEVEPLPPAAGLIDDTPATAEQQFLDQEMAQTQFLDPEMAVTQLLDPEMAETQFFDPEAAESLSAEGAESGSALVSALEPGPAELPAGDAEPGLPQPEASAAADLEPFESVGEVGEGPRDVFEPTGGPVLAPLDSQGLEGSIFSNSPEQQEGGVSAQSHVPVSGLDAAEASGGEMPNGGHAPHPAEAVLDEVLGETSGGGSAGDESVSRDVEETSEISDAQSAPQPVPESIAESAPEPVADTAETHSHGVEAKAVLFAERNPWFGKSATMTKRAYAIHDQLVDVEGIEPDTDQYYSEIEKRIAISFPSAVHLVGGASVVLNKVKSAIADRS